MARQRVARVSSVLAIVLVLVAIPALATGAPAADRAALGDIRTTPLLDDFNRPNENPLSGAGSWAKADASSQGIQLLNNRVTLAAGGLARYQWTPEGIDGDVEVWARYAGAGMDDGAAAELVIVTDVGGSNQLDGYALRAVNTFGGAGWQIRRLQNWSATVVATTCGPHSHRARSTSTSCMRAAASTPTRYSRSWPRTACASCGSMPSATPSRSAARAAS